VDICGYVECEEIDLDTFNYHIEYGELEAEVLSSSVTFYDNGMGHGVFEVLQEGVTTFWTNVAS